jgi:hypothetical protein
MIEQSVREEHASRPSDRSVITKASRKSGLVASAASRIRQARRRTCGANAQEPQEIRGQMTTSSTDPKVLIALAGRMGIPAGEAARQVAQLVDVESTVENADVLQTLCAPKAAPRTEQ